MCGLLGDIIQPPPTAESEADGTHSSQSCGSTANAVRTRTPPSRPIIHSSACVTGRGHSRIEGRLSPRFGDFKESKASSTRLSLSKVHGDSMTAKSTGRALP
jgi:hypothetical protein